MYLIMLSENKDGFISSFPILMSLISFSFFIQSDSDPRKKAQPFIIKYFASDRLFLNVPFFKVRQFSFISLLRGLFYFSLFGF